MHSTLCHIEKSFKDDLFENMPFSRRKDVKRKLRMKPEAFFAVVHSRKISVLHKGSADGRACARPDRGFFDDTESFHKLVEFLTCHLLDFLRIPWPLEVPVLDTLVKE